MVLTVEAPARVERMEPPDRCGDSGWELRRSAVDLEPLVITESLAGTPREAQSGNLEAGRRSVPHHIVHKVGTAFAAASMKLSSAQWTAFAVKERDAVGGICARPNHG